MKTHIREGISSTSLCNVSINKKTAKIILHTNKHLCADCYGILLLKGLKLQKVYIGNEFAFFATPKEFTVVTE